MTFYKQNLTEGERVYRRTRRAVALAFGGEWLKGEEKRGDRLFTDWRDDRIYKTKKAVSGGQLRNAAVLWQIDTEEGYYTLTVKDVKSMADQNTELWEILKKYPEADTRIFERKKQLW